MLILISALANNPGNRQPGPEETACNADQDNDEINLDNPSSTDINKYSKGFIDVLEELEGYIDPF